MGKSQKFRQKMEYQSQRIVAAMLDARGQVGTHNRVRLNGALRLGGRSDLIDRTLLSPSVHKSHHELLFEKYLARLEKIKSQATMQGIAAEALARKRLRFLTLVHSVELLDVSSTIASAEIMRKKLLKALKKAKGIWCLGTIEVEVISMQWMREKRRLSAQSESEMRKLDVCEELCCKLYKHEESLALVHFHGVIDLGQSSEYAVDSAIKSEKSWSAAPRQIQMKPISETFAGKRKSIRQNLNDIARYITKGGNDWVAGKSYLRYKIGFDHGYEDAELAMQQDWRSNEIIRSEHKTKGIEDSLSMTGSEIIFLAETIDSLMSRNRNRLGYWIHN